VASGIAPVMGGFLSDTFGPGHDLGTAGFIAGLLSTLWFVVLHRRVGKKGSGPPLPDRQNAYTDMEVGVYAVLEVRRRTTAISP